MQVPDGGEHSVKAHVIFPFKHWHTLQGSFSITFSPCSYVMSCSVQPMSKYGVASWMTFCSSTGLAFKVGVVVDLGAGVVSVAVSIPTCIAVVEVSSGILDLVSGTVGQTVVIDMGSLDIVLIEVVATEAVKVGVF